MLDADETRIELTPMRDPLSPPPSAWEWNAAVIDARWPRVFEALRNAPRGNAAVVDGVLRYRGVQVVSAVDPMAEARAQLDKCETAPTYCFGMGLGHLPDLLKFTRVTVVLPNLEIARAAFEHEVMEWMRWTNVELALAGDIEWDGKPFVHVPMECWLADPQGYEIRDRIRMKCDDDITREHLVTDRTRITEQYNHNRARADQPASAFYGSAPSSHAVVVGAGPTLTGQIAWLKRSGLRPIIACPAALRPLLAADIVPDQVVIMESGTSNVGYLDGLDLAKLRRAALCYNPEVDPKFLEAWPGPTFSFAEAWLRGTVLHSCADLAVKMGATEVTLLGFDCCRPAGREYADGAGVPGEGYPDTPYRMPTLDGYGHQVMTTPGMVRWHRGMQDFIAARPSVKFYKRGRAGVDIKGATWVDEASGGWVEAIALLRSGRWGQGERMARRMIEVDAAPLEVRVEFDTAIERADFVAAADVVAKWEASTRSETAREDRPDARSVPE